MPRAPHPPAPKKPALDAARACARRRARLSLPRPPASPAAAPPAHAPRVRRSRTDGAVQMDLCESNRVSEGLDIWVVKGFAQEKLNCDPAKLQKDLEDTYPVRGKGRFYNL